MATYVARDIDAKIVSRQSLVERLAKALPRELLARPAELEQWLAERQTLDPLFSNGIFVVPPDGEGAIADAPAVTTRKTLSYRNSDWFVAVRDSRRPAIGRPTRGRATKEPLVIMAAPVLDGDGRLLAVLAGVTALAAPGFLDLVQEQRLGKGGGFLLVSTRDKLFVAASEPDMVLAPTPAAGVNPLHDRAMAGYRGSGVTVNDQGVEELSSMVSIPSASWFLVARMPTAEALKPVNKAFNFVLINSSLLVLAILAFMVLILRRTFRPLAQAATQAHAMADGEMPLQPLAVVKDDEVGELTAGFNYLLHKLQDKEAALLQTMEELRSSEARLEHLAHHDSLTGLPNRILLTDRLELALARANRSGQKLALLFLDLDGFKLINDSHGHDVGDQVLKQVAARLQAELRQADTVARLGGDEFIVLLADLDDARDAASMVARKCIEALRLPFLVEGVQLQLGVSVGIACYPDDGRHALSLLAHSDQAMYRAKQNGRNRYEAWAALN
jgi:diguanylate cyclase (GGDEF)-like protein